MDNKGQVAVGAFILLAVGVIVGLTLLSGTGGIASGVGAMITTADVVNQTVTMPAAGSSLEIAGYGNYQGTPIVTNATGGQIVTATNYTFTSSVSTGDSQKSLFLNALTGPHNSRTVNISFTGEPDGYSSEASARAVAPLIIVFSALAILAITLGVAKAGVFD